MVSNANAYHKEWRTRNRESINARGRLWRQNNSEQVSAAKKLYYSKNRDWLLARQNAYRVKNRDKIHADYKQNSEQYNERRRERWRTDPSYKNRRLSANLKKKFGKTLEEYEHQLKMQNYLCAACKKPLILGGRRPPWDHDHTTGTMRGIIHKGCNVALGEVHENPNTLRLLAEYIEYWKP